MKKIITVILALALAAMMFASCSAAATSSAVNTEKPTETETPADTEAPGENIVSPMTDYTTLKDMFAAEKSIIMHDAPQGSENVSYSTISAEDIKTVAQIIFTFDGNTYTYRAAADGAGDIAGVHDQFKNAEQLTSQNGNNAGGEYKIEYNDGDPMALATWTYADTKCQYSLFSETAYGEDQKMLTVLDQIMQIDFDPDGNPITHSDDPVDPAKVTGTVEGSVVDIADNAVTINMDNGNTITFMLTYIDKTDAKAGDVVKIEYSGDLADAPEAVTITVTKSAPEKLEVSGTVTSFDKKSVHVKTSSGNVYGFSISSDTKIGGKATSLKEGDAVTVTYTGDLTEVPKAANINITKVAKDPVDTKNKTLNGKVTDLGSKKVTMYAENGKTYSFVRTDSTEYTGKYKLKVGSTIKVTYDGYASDTPNAKIIKVIAPPDPTPPDPDKTYKVSGLVKAIDGNALTITDENGKEHSFLLADPAIEGDLVVDAFATVTYKKTSDGPKVTKIVCQLPIAQ